LEEIGRAYLYLLKNDLHKQPFGFIEDIFVRQDLRSQGYGSQLLVELIKEAKKQGCYKLIANSRVDRKDLHGWYEKMGFRRHGFEFRLDF
jgi:GNAT superfamily N-acetyltransferase